MNVTFYCPHCGERARTEVASAAGELKCPICTASWPVSATAVADGKLSHCLVCPSNELFVRKDFSQSLGIGIVVAGIVVSSIFWAYRMPFWAYAVLFSTALLDVIVYFAVGNLLECYRCQAQYRGIGIENHAGFDLETHEKHRQQRIRLAQQERQ
jgi:hypothetical protein